MRRVQALSPERGQQQSTNLTCAGRKSVAYERRGLIVPSNASPLAHQNNKHRCDLREIPFVLSLRSFELMASRALSSDKALRSISTKANPAQPEARRSTMKQGVQATAKAELCRVQTDESASQQGVQEHFQYPLSVQAHPQASDQTRAQACRETQSKTGRPQESTSRRSSLTHLESFDVLHRLSHEATTPTKPTTAPEFTDRPFTKTAHGGSKHCANAR